MKTIKPYPDEGCVYLRPHRQQADVWSPGRPRETNPSDGWVVVDTSAELPAHPVVHPSARAAKAAAEQMCRIKGWERPKTLSPNANLIAAVPK